MTFHARDGLPLYCGALDLPTGALGRLWAEFGAEVVVAHPTFHNETTIGRQLAEGIRGAAVSFAGRRVAFVVSDGTWTAKSDDHSTVDAASAAAAEALRSLGPAERDRVQVAITPYDGYGGDHTPGKGSALKLVYDELAACAATLLVVLDGDLRNDMARWQALFARLEGAHRARAPERPFFVTARYARHFVDASLTRFVVGPLTTLMGRYVPGGISGDIALSAAAVAHERASRWTEARRKYGTDIATTFDNIADPQTVIYELYLGAKLHDITDEGKLSVMPTEVIGAALERLAHWEATDGRVTAGLAAESELAPLERWGPERTGIDFVDPGMTDVFDVDTKIDVLLRRFDDFAPAIETVCGPHVLRELRARRERLAALQRAGDGPLCFLGVDAAQWIEQLQRAVAHLLRHDDLEAPKRCLNYLYTAAFLEFVKGRLADLGHTTLAEVRRAQRRLGVPAADAAAFYEQRVDAVARDLALGFWRQRARIAELLSR